VANAFWSAHAGAGRLADQNSLPAIAALAENLIGNSALRVNEPSAGSARSDINTEKSHG